MESEIRFQPDDLVKQATPKRRLGGIFAGSGDSYAAALAVQMMSGGQELCCHPLDLVDRPDIARGKNVYLISISGRTLSNINAARAVRNVASRIIAVTSNPSTPLAQVCDTVIKLNYRSSGVTTSGTNSFTASLITSLSLAMKMGPLEKPASLLRHAERQARIAANRMALGNGTFYVLGNGTLYPIAIYGSLKLNEVLGAKAFPYAADEFGHSPIFSARSKDAIIILGRDADCNRRLEERLQAEQLNVARIAVSSNTEVEILLYATFFLQTFALHLAKLRRINDCYFLRNKSLLKASSQLIYS